MFKEVREIAWSYEKIIDIILLCFSGTIQRLSVIVLYDFGVQISYSLIDFFLYNIGNVFFSNVN